MSSADAALLDYCTLDPDPIKKEEETRSTYASPASLTPSKLINHWKEWERTLRLSLAKNRSQKIKRDGGAVIDAPDIPADAAMAAKNAMAMESPLEAELLLDKARWDAIESFQSLNVFNENAMYAYLLKLLLMERRAAFKTENGLTEYKALYTAILGEPK